MADHIYPDVADNPIFPQLRVSEFRVLLGVIYAARLSVQYLNKSISESGISGYRREVIAIEQGNVP